MRMRPGIEIGGLSDVGCHRDNNEDYYSYWEPESEEEFAQKGRLAVVADGMGGYEGGQEASRLAVEIIVETYRSAADDPQAALLASLQAAHEQIRQYGEKHPRLLGMGTTCTALALNGRRLYFAHVGDSRLYLVRGDKISRLTKDHSYVGRLLESGIISSREAETHPQRHILTAALGAGIPLEADFPESPIQLEADDVLVLCTDGLWGQVEEKELLQVVGANSAADACHLLVGMAKHRGGPDNITVQILRLSANGKESASRS
jgi:protein phosphatase